MPGTDLQKVLGEVRDQYEGVMEKNRQEAEALHQSQVRKGLAKQILKCLSPSRRGRMQTLSELIYICRS